MLKLFPFLLQKKIYNTIVQEFGAPDIVHVQVPMNAGVYAYYAEVSFIDGIELVYVGDVTIVR